MILASHIDVDTFRKTAAIFAESSLQEGTALRTKYMLISGMTQGTLPQFPHLIFCLELFKNATKSNVIFRNWKENVATLYSHKNPKASKPALAEFGDKLWGIAHNVDAAHICYLLAELDIGGYDNPNTRLVLIGGDHKIRQRTLASVQNIQRTEVFEFGKSLGNSLLSFPSILPFKLVYAYYLAEVGLVEHAKRYFFRL
jgi:hypothetical protein